MHLGVESAICCNLFCACYLFNHHLEMVRLKQEKVKLDTQAEVNSGRLYYELNGKMGKVDVGLFSVLYCGLCFGEKCDR